MERGTMMFPALSESVDIDAYAREIMQEVGDRTFCASSPAHARLLDALDVRDGLAPVLHQMARKHLGYQGSLEDQYHIARLVTPGNSTEQYRAHFDSHLFTLVIPLVIPTAADGNEAGELLYRPNARRQPRSELENIAGKAWFKRYANRRRATQLLAQDQFTLESFAERRPLLFAGRTTLHTNRAVSPAASGPRLTLLAHFFDPSPRYGVGNMLRTLRRR
ncbi:hypothetical protein GCM10010082_14770 [Kushneria pakistanensis]|uniref:2OG-Fe(II) oxygenase n=2 Tax=Kushneria pakistanensis TaxID=1508770 RepID=A0ABQ3FGW4_9GAMM|nr:hypothetical protein GCM10010082_14770 [Kushneria pakistanensis]